VPALPTWKKDAIKALGFGVYNKIVLYFEEVFWQGGVEFLGYLSETRGECPIFCNLYKHTQQPILVCHIGEHYCKKIEMDTKSDQEIVDITCNILRKMFPSTTLPKLVKFFVSRWHQDPFTMGGYSYPAIGCRNSDYKALEKPISNLFFAGEATTEDYPATVHGAYNSGLKVAKEVNAFLSNQKV